MSLRVTVAVALPSRQEVVEVRLAEGSTVADALAEARIAARFPEMDLATARVGIWSRPCVRETVLRDGDRVEVYRPLQAPPREQRRRRAAIRPSTRSRSAP